MADLSALGPTVEFAVRKMPAMLRNDLRQDAWLAIVAAAPRYEETRGASMRTFMDKRARGGIADALRRLDPLSRAQRKLVREGHLVFREVSTDILSALPAPDCDPEETAIEGDLQRRLPGCLSALPERERAVIEGLFFEEAPCEELAERLALSVPGVYCIRKRALKRLRHLLEFRTN